MVMEPRPHALPPKRGALIERVELIGAREEVMGPVGAERAVSDHADLTFGDPHFDGRTVLNLTNEGWGLGVQRHSGQELGAEEPVRGTSPALDLDVGEKPRRPLDKARWLSSEGGGASSSVHGGASSDVYTHSRLPPAPKLALGADGYIPPRLQATGQIGCVASAFRI